MKLFLFSPVQFISCPILQVYRLKCFLYYCFQILFFYCLFLSLSCCDWFLYLVFVFEYVPRPCISATLEAGESSSSIFSWLTNSVYVTSRCIETVYVIPQHRESVISRNIETIDVIPQPRESTSHLSTHIVCQCSLSTHTVSLCHLSIHRDSLCHFSTHRDCLCRFWTYRVCLYHLWTHRVSLCHPSTHSLYHLLTHTVSLCHPWTHRDCLCHLSIHRVSLSYLPTPPLGQDMTQGQFLSDV